MDDKFRINLKYTILVISIINAIASTVYTAMYGFTIPMTIMIFLSITIMIIMIIEINEMECPWDDYWED